MNSGVRSGWFEGREWWAKAGLVIVYVSTWVVSSLAITVTFGRFMGYIGIAVLFTSPFCGLYQGMLKVLSRRKSVWKQFLCLPAVLHAVVMVSGAFTESDFAAWILPATGLLVVLYGILTAQAVLADLLINRCLVEKARP